MYVCKAMQSRSFLSQISYAGDESGFFIFMAYIPIFVCITMDFFTMHQYYKHFKGNIYKVLYIAKHSETLEDYVVYQAMYGEHGIWVRPKAAHIVKIAPEFIPLLSIPADTLLLLAHIF